MHLSHYLKNIGRRRAFHEKGFFRDEMPEWEARWETLSTAARRAFLNDVKGPRTTPGRGQIRPGIGRSTLAPGVLTELVAEGFVELGDATSGKKDQILAVWETEDFATRIRGLARFRLLTGDQPDSLRTYFTRWFYDSDTTTELHRIMRAVGLQDHSSGQLMLDLYITGRHWPEWVVQALNDPLAKRIFEELRRETGPVRLAELCARLGDAAPVVVRTGLDSLITRLAVFEDLDPKTLALVFGLFPKARDSMAHALVPRERPPLVASTELKDLGPHGSMIIDDLRSYLLEITTEPPRLRQDESLYQKELTRFVEALPVLPDWLSSLYHVHSGLRLEHAEQWARGLKLVHPRPAGHKEKRLEITHEGNRWLISSIEEQYRRIFKAITMKVRENRSFYSGSDREIDRVLGYAAGDEHFLGTNLVAVKLEKGIHPAYARAGSEDFQALRDSVDRAFSKLPIGVFYPLDRIVAHLAFQDDNPLLLGLGQEGVVVLESSQTIPPLVERREGVAKTFLTNFLRRRLLPLGCFQAAIDDAGQVHVARRPWYDLYFGRNPEMTGLTEQGVCESRVVVQPDFSIVIIGLNPAPAAELSPFCDRDKKSGVTGAVTLKLTRESVVRAVANGLDPAMIGERLTRRSSTQVPANVLRQVQDWSGWVRKVKVATQTIIRCPDRDTADRVQATLKRHAERLNDTMLAIVESKLTSADRTRLRDQGVLIERE